MSEELKIINNDYCIIDYRGHKIIIDNQDTHLFFKYFYKIDLCSNKTKLYVKRNIKIEKNKWSSSMLHRDIIGLSCVGKLVDHINGNTLDNRRENLRVVNKSQNRINSKVQSDSSTGISGVSFHKTTGKYQSYIWVNGKRKHIGVYLTINEAAKSRKEAEELYYGQYARK